LEVYKEVYNMNELACAITEADIAYECRIRHAVAEDLQRGITLWLDLVVYIYIYIYIYITQEVYLMGMWTVFAFEDVVKLDIAPPTGKASNHPHNEQHT
jgi:hypothetical protein